MSQHALPSKGLSLMVKEYIAQYFKTLDGAHPTDALYHIVIKEVEKPLIEVTLQSCQYNQKKTAQVLGMNRNTLRRKIDEHHIELPKSY